MPDLPPTQFDEDLAIGGEEIEARKLRSRMTVEVEVNGKGPYDFVVDSGADTSAVGEALVGGVLLGGATSLSGVVVSVSVSRGRFGCSRSARASPT